MAENLLSVLLQIEMPPGKHPSFIPTLKRSQVTKQPITFIPETFALRTRNGCFTRGLRQNRQCLSRRVESGSKGLVDVNYPIESRETASLLCGIGNAIQYPGINRNGKEKEKKRSQTSLVAPWLRTLPPTQGTWVPSSVREDPTRRRAPKPVHRNP